MSYEDGWAAINLDMPKRVPRTEYSAEQHWELIKAVTGIDVGSDSTPEEKNVAGVAFMKAWNFDFIWGLHFGRGTLAKCNTSMGHAEYAAGGVDRDDNISCPFTEPEQVLAFDPEEVYGRSDPAELVEYAEARYAHQRKYLPFAVNMTGVYVTLVSGLIDIFGWEMLLTALGLDPEGFGEVANRYAAWVQQYFDAMAGSSVPVVMVHDDIVWTAGPFAHPDWYRKYVFPNYRKLFAPLVEAGKRIAYTSDGAYTMFVDDIADCGVHGFVMEPTTDMAAVAATYGRTHVFVGNADTRILLSGTREEIRAEVKRCMDIGKNCPGFFMAVGNHIPANTPVENALYYNEVYEELGRR